jgi:hypothetical protein
MTSCGDVKGEAFVDPPPFTMLILYLQPSGMDSDSPTWQSLTVLFSLIKTLLQITLPVIVQLRQKK